MAISFQLPDSVEQHLRESCADLDQVAKEAALVELYRQDKITHSELAQALGLGRIETDEVLASHGVTEDLLTSREHEAQLAGLRKLLRR
jgi:hypothetical protein